jgi:hypothetical protein
MRRFTGLVSCEPATHNNICLKSSRAWEHGKNLTATAGNVLARCLCLPMLFDDFSLFVCQNACRYALYHRTGREARPFQRPPELRSPALFAFPCYVINFHDLHACLSEFVSLCFVSTHRVRLATASPRTSPPGPAPAPEYSPAAIIRVRPQFNPTLQIFNRTRKSAG